MGGARYTRFFTNAPLICRGPITRHYVSPFKTTLLVPYFVITFVNIHCFKFFSVIVSSLPSYSQSDPQRFKSWKSAAHK